MVRVWSSIPVVFPTRAIYTSAPGISDSFKDFLLGVYRLVLKLLGKGRYYRPIKQLTHGNESVHETVLKKIERDSRYNPRNPGM
jgi:hypothetical protein